MLSLVIPVAAPYFYEVQDIGIYTNNLLEVTKSASRSGNVDIKESPADFNWIH